jgi:hypothetical protein
VDRERLTNSGRVHKASSMSHFHGPNLSERNKSRRASARYCSINLLARLPICTDKVGREANCSVTHNAACSFGFVGADECRAVWRPGWIRDQDNVYFGCDWW